MFWGLGVLGGVHLWVGHCCLSLAGGVFGVLGGVQLGVVCLLPFFWAVCSVGGAGRGAVMGRQSLGVVLDMLGWGLESLGFSRVWV